MRRRPASDPVSPRALARLRRGGRGAAGWVPSREVLGLGGDVGGGVSAVVGPLAAAGGSDLLDDPQGQVTDRGRHRRGGPRTWFRAPAALVGARWQPGRAAVAGVLLVTAVAVLVLGLRVAWARSGDGEVLAPGPGPVGVEVGAVSVGVPASASPLPSSSSSSLPSAGPASGAPGVTVVVVHVVGQVARGGVLRLPAGARVADAVEAAGGATRGADLAALNLARVLVDGEQVRVPRPGEVLATGPVAGSGGGGSLGPETAGGVQGGGTAPVSLNTADAAGLDTLPGIGPVIAQRVVDWRTEHGRFTSVDELSEVSGIGEKLLAQVRPLVTI